LTGVRNLIARDGCYEGTKRHGGEPRSRKRDRAFPVPARRRIAKEAFGRSDLIASVRNARVASVGQGGGRRCYSIPAVGEENDDGTRD
jgi:hypothetical protein